MALEKQRVMRHLNRRFLHALTKTLLILFLLWGIRPAPVQFVPGPPRKVCTTNPVVGVHTRLTDEVEEWKIHRTLTMVREMGASWIVEFFPWPYIEPAPKRFDWQHSDQVVEHAINQGLTLIARLGWTPSWARPDPDEQPTTHTYLDVQHYDDFAEFVEAFAARYRGYVRYVVIWNEPNLSYEWGYRPVSPEDYVALLKAVYPRAHTANPEVIVLAGALAPTLEPENSPVGMNDLLYLERMYQAGAQAYLDGLAVHAYGMNAPPQDPPDPEKINFRRVELLREIMVKHGDANKPILVTEAGWNDHPRWLYAVRPAQRIVYTIDAYEWAYQHWPYCLCVAMWAFRYPARLRNYQDYYAFVTPDFEPRVIYLEVQRYTQSTACEAP